MLSKAYSAFFELIKNQFPNLRVLLRWPPPTQRPVFPFLVILPVSNSMERFQPRVVENNTLQNGDEVQTIVTGQWESRVDMHYFSKDLDDEADFQTKITDFFDSLLSRDRSQSSNITFSFGTKLFERANAMLVSWTLSPDSQSIQAGERRAIAELILDIPHIITRINPIIKTPQLVDKGVGENIIVTDEDRLGQRNAQ